MILIAILVGALIGFGPTKLRHDVVALCALTASVVTGLTPADEACDGFGHPAVITVIGVLLISTSLKNSGVVDLITAKVDAFSKKKLTHLTHLVGGVSFVSLSGLSWRSPGSSIWPLWGGGWSRSAAVRTATTTLFFRGRNLSSSSC
jgi:di/tricarboxylate transporter